MQSIKSLIQKANTIMKQGVAPLMDGVHNFNNQDDDIEEIAKHRLETCVGCPFFQVEEFKPLQITDPRLPEASGKKCGECGCILNYKLRQFQSICPKWEF